MISSVDLEVMNLTNPEVTWKSVTKGRRSRKSIAARSLNGVAKSGNSTSPKRVGDFSGSDSDKVGERSCKWQPRGIDESAKFRFGEGFRNIFLGDQTKREYRDAGDFSGIELLAAAASMDDGDDDNANKQNLVMEDSLMPKNDDASASATQPKVALKCTEPENSSSNTAVHGGSIDCSPVLGNSAAASRGLCGSPEDETMPKLNRQHWDLNTPMDAWDDLYDDSIAGNTFKGVNDGTKDECLNLKIEDDKLTTVSSDRICSVRSSLEKHLGEPPSNPYFNAVGETSYQAAERDSSERNPTTNSNSDVDMNMYSHVTITNSILDSSPFTKPSSSAGVLMSEEKIYSLSGRDAKIPDEDCSSDVREFERTTASDRILTRSQVSESPINFQCKDNRDFQKTTELPGTFIQDGWLVLTGASEMKNDENFVSGSRITDFQGHLGMESLVAKHEDNSLANELTRNSKIDLSKSCSPEAQLDDPFASVGKIGSTIDGPPNSNVIQNNHVKMVNGDDLNGFQEGYNSPYEDGELRGSFLYSWGDNEMEDECIDYESDGRNGDDGSDGADYPGSEIVEGGSEGLRGTVRSRSLVKGFPEGKSKGESKRFLRGPVKNDTDINEIAGKGSKTGSGTTVEQSMEKLIDENDNGMNRSRLTRIDEYESKTARGKLQSRIEGRSYMDAADGKGGFFMQQCRSRYLGSYSRSDRDISPNKYLGRYRPATRGGRDGVHQWTTSWDSGRCYNTSSYQGPEGGRPHTRPSKNGDPADTIGRFDFHNSRQTTNYLPKGLHRPFMRRSPVERDDYFCASRRMPPTRGVGNYRGRGHYSQRGGRDIEPLTDDAGPLGPMPRYLSKRERSFSPSCGRNSQLPLPRRRSRSRSRTRSPTAWHPHREQRVFGNNNRRNISRSPDFRFEARMERMMMPPISKPNFASNYGGGGYISPSRGRRWVDDHSNNFANNHVRRRRSPVRVFRQAQRFDADEASVGRLKSDEYFRPPVMRPGRFPFTANGVRRKCKLESGYDDRRREDGGEVMQRDLHCDDGGNMSRYRNNPVNDLETGSLNNLNNEDDVPRDVPQSKGDGEDKRTFEI